MKNLNKDWQTRDTLLFGDAEIEAYKYGGCRRFSSADVETIRTLMEFGYIDPDDCQNCSPYAGDILAFLESHPCFTAHGYAVSPDRADYRITLEGVELRGTYDSDTFIDFLELFRFADEFMVGTDFLYCWYD